MGGRARWGKKIFPVPSLLATVALLELAKKFVDLVLIIGVPAAHGSRGRGGG